MKLDFIFRLVHCSSEDVSFNSFCLNLSEGIKQFYLLMWFMKIRQETPFKGDNVNALVKTSNCEKLVLYFSERVQKIAAFAMHFWFSVTKQSLIMVSVSPNDQKYPRYPLVLKLNVFLARPLCFVILYTPTPILSCIHQPLFCGCTLKKCHSLTKSAYFEFK